MSATKTAPTNEVVLHIYRSDVHDATRVVVTPMVIRHEDRNYPTNISFDTWSSEPFREFADLEMSSYVSDTFGCAVLEFEFRDIFSVTLRRATSMAKTLARILKMIDKEEAKEHGDRLTVFAKATGATRCVWYDRKANGSRNWNNEINWQYLSLAAGREKLRSIVRDAEAEIVKPEKKIAVNS
jgi:uncharacterized protein YodC (DUF2158 family)